MVLQGTLKSKYYGGTCQNKNIKKSQTFQIKDPKSFPLLSYSISVTTSYILFNLFNSKKEKKEHFKVTFTKKCLATGLFTSSLFIALLCSVILSFNGWNV